MSESDQSTIRMPVLKPVKSNSTEVSGPAERKRSTLPWRGAIVLLCLLGLGFGVWGTFRYLTGTVLVEKNEAIADLDDLDFTAPGFNSQGRFHSQISGSKRPRRLTSRQKKDREQPPAEVTEPSATQATDGPASGVWLTGQIEGIELKDESVVPEQIADKPDTSAQR